MTHRLSCNMSSFACLLAWSCVRPRRHSSRHHLASLSCITTGTVSVLFSQISSRLHNCAQVRRGSFEIRACTPVRGTGAATLRVPPTLCRALFPRASGRRLHGVHLDRAPWPRPFPSRLLRVARARLRQVTPAAVAASLTRCLVDHIRILLIDRSAESVESFLPVRGGAWCRSREHQSSTHSAESSRGSLRRHASRTVESSRSSRRGSLP